MTLAYLEELKTKYTAKQNYFKNMEFDHLADDFTEFLRVLDWAIQQAQEENNSNFN